MPHNPAEVQFWLEWAGQRLLSLDVGKIKPQQYRSFWPDYPDDKYTAFGYTGSRLRPASPSANEIPLMDDILNLVLLIPDITSRRVVNARCLIHPINNRYRYSWTKIAFILHTNRHSVKVLHQKGIKYIAGRVPDGLVYRLRQSLPSSANFA